MSRVANIGDGTDTYASYQYLGAGRIVVEDYEDIEVRLDYAADGFAALDRFDRVVDQVWTDYGENPDVTLDEYTYTYDRAGNRTSRDNELHSAFDEDYTYDGLDRLTSSERAEDYDQTWTLDGLGNFRTFDDDGDSQTRTTNAVNEISAITGGWITPEYDAAGNMIAGPKPGSGTTRVHYIFDAWNRLVIVKADDSGDPGDTLAEYQYDGTNRRIQKVVTEDGGGPSEAHYFYNQSWQLIEERFVDGQGVTVASNHYVWSPRFIDALVVRFHDGNGDGDYLDAGDNIRYWTDDANYNVTATIDAGTGDVMDRYVYTAYGAATTYDDDWSNPAPPTEDGPLYCGYFFDAETGLYHVRNRYYNSSLSTFITKDPMNYAAHDSNLYRYIQSNPLTETDPFGLAVIFDIPKSFCKCNFVAAALGMGSGVDQLLFNDWMYGKGAPVDWGPGGMNIFDSTGKQRNKIWRDIDILAGPFGGALACGQHATRDYRQPKPVATNATSKTAMISNYWFWWDCRYTVAKQCDANQCCKSITVSASCNFHAFDFVEFLKGEPTWNESEKSWDNAFGKYGVYVSDRLVRECYPFGQGFNFTSDVSNKRSWTTRCPSFFAERE